MNKHKLNIFPDMQIEEIEQLMGYIQDRGYDKSQPIYTYEDDILDGWHRQQACEVLDIEPVYKEFEGTAAEALDFVMMTNKRRNLTSSQWSTIAAEHEELYELFAEEAKERQGTRTDLDDNIQQLVAEAPEDRQTRAKLAKIFNTNKTYIDTARKLKETEPEKFEEVKSGEKSIKEVIKERKQEARKKELKIIQDKIDAGDYSELPEGTFEVIVIDPPWNYGTSYDVGGRRVASPYPEMSDEELMEIELPSSDDCILFLWTTHKFIWNAKELLDVWGFEYRATLVWDKQKIGMGDLFRMQCEFCLVGIRGKPTFNNDHTHRDIISSVRGKHSQKPDEFYEMIDSLCVGRKLDYFARSERSSWEVYGAEMGR